MMLNFHKAGIIVKPHEDVVTYLQRMVKELRSFKVEVILEKAAADMLAESSLLSREEVIKKSDIIILIGGDGTFLSVAPHAVERDIPIAGFNLGTLGFLTELSKENLEDNLEKIFFRPLKISKRKLIQLLFKDERLLALNDIVVAKGNIARIIKLTLHINNDKVAEVSGDGVIVATPTGSTAYSLSAGGPIVAPEVNGIVITPICPHSLTFRPFVVPDSARIKVGLISHNSEVSVTIDGQKVIPMAEGEAIEISVFPTMLKMINSFDGHYFTLLADKLNWGL